VATDHVRETVRTEVIVTGVGRRPSRNGDADDVSDVEVTRTEVARRPCRNAVEDVTERCPECSRELPRLARPGEFRNPLSPVYDWLAPLPLCSGCAGHIRKLRVQAGMAER